MDHSKHGITHQIREQLNFTDPSKWRKFTNRRLELVDKFNLSSKKASEQDGLILKIADILRLEFGYDDSKINEFDKLVRAAVQSVRRNRKRSLKQLNIQSNNDGWNEKSMFINHITTTTSPTATTTKVGTSIPTIVQSTNQQQHQHQQQHIKLPSIKVQPDLFKFSEQNKQKLLNYITNSSTFFKSIDSPGSINESILSKLGLNSIRASISFILDKFFQVQDMNYLYTKLTSMETLSLVFKSLDITHSSEISLLNLTQSFNLFCKIIGCLVKDYGFDSILYTLGELFHELVLLEYPLLLTFKQQTIVLPINPKEIDEEFNKDINIKYRSNNIQFKFKPMSSTPPTYIELLENCKIAFNCTEKNLRLRIIDEKIEKLSQIFKDLNKPIVNLELYEV
ncbi:hypothetical protein WICMUC_000144 [Wickerhamomyces mucosus]|uniref:Transcription factor VHR1 n=1 Tax=Wickerhamomyces mucosus TaxID=1378264 RepID=A0A9P8TIH1_9ASCO|nr:hypothetical protein WICMUC_000144 [Wickerhamomyces mucosus]